MSVSPTSSSRAVASTSVVPQTPSKDASNWGQWLSSSAHSFLTAGSSTVLALSALNFAQRRFKQVETLGSSKIVILTSLAAGVILCASDWLKMKPNMKQTTLSHDLGTFYRDWLRCAFLRVQQHPQVKENHKDLYNHLEKILPLWTDS